MNRDMYTLVVIGYTGIKRAYLDIPIEEAKRRYEQEQGEDDAPIRIFSFTDEFGVYDAWSTEDAPRHDPPSNAPVLA